MSNSNIAIRKNWHDIFVLFLAPAVILLFISISWILSHWQIGPIFINVSFALIAVLIGGYQRFYSGAKDMLHMKITVNVFITVALAVTVAVGEFRPAAIIIFIMSVVGALESYTLDKTRRTIRDLLNLAPPTANVRRGDVEITVAVAELKVGDIVVIRPGEHIPVDGVVTAGAGSVNQASITGESMPVEKFKDSKVFSGTLNETGRLDVCTVKTGDDTTLAQIVHLVEAAQENKAPITTLADHFTVWFFPIVITLAIAAFLFSGNIKVAVSVLLVACPCAFAIATPSAVTAGIANMAKRAVLVKGGIYFELAGKVDTLLLDKTGTLTFGRPKVVQVICENGATEEAVLMYAAIAEKYSEHPIAKSLMFLAKKRNVAVPDPDDFNAAVGFGVSASYKSKSIVAGKEELLQKHGIPVSSHLLAQVNEQAEYGRTVVLVAYDKEVVGFVAIEDEVRHETVQAVSDLKLLGIRNIIMLTGDNPRVASSVAKQIGVDDFRAGLLPEDKQRIVKELKAEGRKVMMVGDGINDAPALALADIGLAMGAAGTDVAIKAADVTLMNDDLSRLVDFVQMSRKVLRRIKLNIFFSIVYNSIGLMLGTLGLLTPIIAVIFQEAGCISVMLSSTLLLWAHPRILSSSQRNEQVVGILMEKTI